MRKIEDIYTDMGTDPGMVQFLKAILEISVDIRDALTKEEDLATEFSKRSWKTREKVTGKEEVKECEHSWSKDGKGYTCIKCMCIMGVDISPAPPIPEKLEEVESGSFREIKKAVNSLRECIVYIMNKIK